jgi:hypothetical protein
MIAGVIVFIFDTLCALVGLLLIICMCTLIVLFAPVIYAERKSTQLIEKCRELIDVVARARSKWRNRPRVKTGPMPVIGHPYR